MIAFLISAFMWFAWEQDPLGQIHILHVLSKVPLQRKDGLQMKDKNSDEDVIRYLCGKASEETGVSRIILFGSRARGNQNSRSDFDIAVEAPTFDDETWTRWALRIRDEIPTLCGLDLVRLDHIISHEMLEHIRKEGRIIYERKDSSVK